MSVVSRLEILLEPRPPALQDSVHDAVQICVLFCNRHNIYLYNVSLCQLVPWHIFSIVSIFQIEICPICSPGVGIFSVTNVYFQTE